MVLQKAATRGHQNTTRNLRQILGWWGLVRAGREPLHGPWSKVRLELGALALRPKLSLLYLLCLSWKESGCDADPKNIAMALSGLIFLGHLSRWCRLWGEGVPLSMGKRKRGAIVPRCP